MKQEQDELCYPVKKVQFRTCVELYKKWKVTKLRYRTAPSNGIEVEVEYADTLELINPELESNFSISSKVPEYDDIENIKCFPLTSNIGLNQNYKPLTALCLHGAPGCHKDYQHLIKYFIKRNVRVLAPKFPNYELTKKTPFCHSPAEKAEYIKDFLAAIQVDRIDLLLCHSSGLFVAARLINDSLNAFGIQIENEVCKKCKKDKNCSNCAKNKKRTEDANKRSDLEDSTTDDEEEEELFQKFNEKVEDLKKLNAQKELLNKVPKSKEYKGSNSNLTDQKQDLENELKQQHDTKSEEKQTENEKQIEQQASEKASKNSDEKQVNQLNELDEGVFVEGYQDTPIEEQVNGRQREARKRFSTYTIQKSKIYFGSLILINVVSHKRSKLMNPVLRNSLYEPSAFFYQLKISRSVVRFCGKIYLDIFGSPVDYNNFDNTILTLTTVLRSNIKSLKLQLERITKTNLPILMFFSENDRLITKGQSYELANFLNVNYITRDFSDASHHNYDVFNYNSKQKKPSKSKPEENNNNVNEVNQNQDTQIESQSTTSSDEYDSLRHHESEIESDTSSTKNSSSTEEGSLKSIKTSDCELKTKELDSEAHSETTAEGQLILNQLKYPYAVSIKKGRHYSHITHSHVMDEHIAKLITVLNLRKN